jgi:hypothetical protein
MVRFLIEACAHSRHLPLPRRDARRMLQGKYGTGSMAAARRQSENTSWRFARYDGRVANLLKRSRDEP